MRYRFHTFEIDSLRRELLINGRQRDLAPKAFDLLIYLVENKDRMISKRELLDEFWPSNVSDAVLLKSISLVRKALNTGPSNEEIIKTHHGHGYSFVAQVEACEEPAERLTSSVELTEQRLASVLCLNFSEVSLDKSLEIKAEREQFIASAQSVVERHQGVLLHMMIDGFTAAFGLSGLYEDVSRRSSRCAAELLQLGKRKGKSKLTEAFAKIAIDTDVLELMDAQNSLWKPPSDIERRATELVKSARGGEIIISAKTLDQLHNEVEVVPVENVFKLISPPLPRAGIPGRPHKNPSKFIGRLAEVAFLDANLNKLIHGQGSVITLSGPAGIGKTRLVSELLAKQGKFDCSSILLNCLPSLQNTPLAPIKILCRSLLEFAERPGNTIHQALLRELLEESESPENVLEGLSDHERRQYSYQLVNRMLGTACNRQPIILVVEDTHWIDPSSLEFLNNLIRSAEEKRLMLVITTRPVDSTLLIEAILHLSPLGQKDSRALIQGNSLTCGLDAKTSDLLVERAGGNPFFLEELAFAAKEAGKPDDQLPKTVQAVIAVRVGALPLELRTLLYIVAVIGPPAELELISHLVGISTEETLARLERLAKAGFIVEDMNGFSFRHILISDTSYSMVAINDRQQLHREIASYWLKKSQYEDILPEKLAWHYQESGDINSAIPHWIAASRAASMRMASRECVVFSKNGLKLVDENNKDHLRYQLDLLLLLSPALTTLKGFAAQEAGNALSKAQQIDELVGTPKTRIRIIVGLWIYHWVKGDLKVSLNYGNKLMELAKASKNPALLLQSHAGLGQVLVHLGREPEALVHLDKALSYIQTTPPATLPEQNAAVSCAAYAAWSASLMGKSELAKAFYSQSLSLTDAFKNPFAKAIHYSLCSEYFLFEGDSVQCLELADTAVSLSRKHHFKFWLGTGLVLRGWALGYQGKFESAFAALNEGIPIFEKTGAGVQLANWYGIKAEVEWRSGRLQEAKVSAHTALNHAKKTDDQFFATRVQAVLSEVYAQLDDMTKSELHRQRALYLIQSFATSTNFISLG